MTSIEHPSEERLLSYADASLSEDEQRTVEEHIAECAECTQLARQSLRFEKLWGLSAREHGDVVRRAALEAALAAEEARAAPGLRERLSTWRSRWAGLAETAASIALESAQKGTQVVAEGLESLTRPGSAWQLAPATGGAIRGTGEGGESALLTTSLSTTSSRARLAVQGGDAPEVTVRIDGVPESVRPLVVLLSTDSAHQVRLTQAERPEGTSYLIARFEDLPVGTYVVAVEPLESGNGQ